MKRYASSKLRIFLFVGIIASIAVVWARPGFGQAAAPAPAPAPAAAPAVQTTETVKGPFSLVLENMDFVFVMILAASVWGVTLIIQALIKNRKSVFLPETTNNRIRELIQTGQFQDLMDFTAADPTFVSRAINAAL